LCKALALARVVNYAPRVMLLIVAPLTDDSRGVIFDKKMFIVQATGIVRYDVASFTIIRYYLFEILLENSPEKPFKVLKKKLESN
jgi:hypothetical protein